MQENRRHFPRLGATVLAACVHVPCLAAQEARESRYPASWNAIRNMTIPQIQTMRSKGFRIVHVNRMHGNVFNVSFVRNHGEYHRRGATFFEGTVSDLAKRLRGKRILEIEPGGSLSSPRFVAVMIDNTGDQAKSWSWYYGTASFIASKTRGMRIVDLDAFYDNGKYYYSAVMIANQGDDYRDWWWFANSTRAHIKAQAASLGAQIFDVERFGYGSTDQHCAVLTRHRSRPTPAHDWHNSKSWSEINQIMSTNRGRVVKLKNVGVLSNGTYVYDILVLDNRGHTVIYGKGCGAGRSGPVPFHTVTGQLFPKGAVQIRVQRALPRRLVMLLIGMSDEKWGGHTLPLNLGFLGAPFCELLNSFDVAVPMVSDVSGSATLSTVIPDTAALGVGLHTQFACSDASANGLGMTFSNGVELRIGQ